MKSIILSPLFVFLSLFSFAQNNFEEGAKKMKAFVEAEDYRNAMLYGDKLIGDGVKESFGKYAGEVYLYRGIAKYKFDIFNDAIIDLKKAVAFDKSLSKAYLYIAQIYYDLNSYSMALENVIYFSENHANDIAGLALKSRCLLQLGEPMAAKIIIQKAIALVSSDPELYYIRASVNNALDEKAKACADAKISLKFGLEDAQNLIDSFCGEKEEESLEE